MRSILIGCIVTVVLTPLHQAFGQPAALVIQSADCKPAAPVIVTVPGNGYGCWEGALPYGYSCWGRIPCGYSSWGRMVPLGCPACYKNSFPLPAADPASKSKPEAPK